MDSSLMRRLALLAFVCFVSCKDDYRPIPSVLSAPSTADWADVRYPFRCSLIENGVLVVDLLERVDALSEVVFEWISPWNDTVDPRITSPIDELGRKENYTFSIPDDYAMSSIIFERAPPKTRVVVRVHTKENQGFWETSSRACWTGRRIRAPGPVQGIQVFPFEKTIAQIWLPFSPNGPIDGLILRWCPPSEPNCRSEDVLFSKQPSNVEYVFTTILEPAEDEESQPHQLCVAAYNLRERERLLGKMTCLTT